ncbi:gluconate 2-dehydrogenase subunit 3 family protein [Streptomyces sp. XM4193]|uniref:gluconate 2-dehydrogenase subunit 3 family protein n=1 Tax=Streptomyces sp. XM4193 TaxID=2929782 RepID=UPI001FFB1FA1|nr:gluconate 2-dehydrogenase subunit 3 family protein [Streptomyces sp. XM4193]MCK1795270.1 gluconate 2-dehydrogenase subunit 3 family protein [Streptomyces sp. XM4193]
MTWLHFSGGQAEVVREAMALLVPGPTDLPGEQEPGAREADAVRYADRLLGAFRTEPPLIYAAGSGSAHVPLSPEQRHGWLLRVRELQDAYREGTALLDRLADGDFAAADPAVRHRALRDPRAHTFRGLLFDHAIEGTYGDPVYRGRPAPGSTVLPTPPLPPPSAPEDASENAPEDTPPPTSPESAAPADGAAPSADSPPPADAAAPYGEETAALLRDFTAAARRVVLGGDDG